MVNKRPKPRTVWKPREVVGSVALSGAGSYSEDLGAAGWAYALSRRLAVLHSYGLRVGDFALAAALDAIGFH